MLMLEESRGVCRLSITVDVSHAMMNDIDDKRKGGGGYAGDARDVVLPILEQQRTRDGSDCVVETVDALMRICRSLCSNRGIVQGTW